MKPWKEHAFHFALLFAAAGIGVAVGPWAGAVYARFAQAPPLAIADNSAYLAHADEVLMFGTGSCPFCASTRALLRELDVPFRELRVDDSAAARELFETLGVQGVPVVLVGDRRIHGYREDLLREALTARVRSAARRAPPASRD